MRDCNFKLAQVYVMKKIAINALLNITNKVTFTDYIRSLFSSFETNPTLKTS